MKYWLSHRWSQEMLKYNRMIYNFLPLKINVQRESTDLWTLQKIIYKLIYAISLLKNIPRKQYFSFYGTLNASIHVFKDRLLKYVFLLCHVLSCFESQGVRREMESCSNLNFFYVQDLNVEELSPHHGQIFNFTS